jgi:hypothetical protein
MQHFRIAGLDPERFSHLYGRSDAQLAEQHVYRYRVDTSPGFPDRIEMRDLEAGESALLVNYTHLDHPSPYRSFGDAAMMLVDPCVAFIDVHYARHGCFGARIRRV